MPTTYAIPNGRTVMDATTYTGNGSTQTIVNKDNGTNGFQPDFVWYKSRSSNTWNHGLFDSVRGTTKQLFSNTTGAEGTFSGVTAFNSNGFTVGSDNGGNENGGSMVAWQWQAGQGTTSSNTNGSITSTVSVNATAGFSVVTYTGTSTGSSGTIGHGLGVTPAMVITKRRDGASNWIVWHTSLPSSDYILQLNNTAAQVNSNTDPSWLGGPCPAPNSTTFGANYVTGRNVSGQTQVAYCWAPVAGFSQFGSYTGNGSADGPFVYTGFQPAFVMIKASSTTGNWLVHDNQRPTYNPENKELYPNLSLAEGTSPSLDFVSNGFKIRDTYSDINSSGVTYIYAAFASNPFKYANAR